jgi:hypothetical protein
MDPESIGLYLTQKHLGAVQVEAEINNVLGEGTVHNSIITWLIRKRCFTVSSEALEVDGSDAKDNTFLDEQP